MSARSPYYSQEANLDFTGISSLVIHTPKESISKPLFFLQSSYRPLSISSSPYKTHKRFSQDYNAAIEKANEENLMDSPRKMKLISGLRVETQPEPRILLPESPNLSKTTIKETPIYGEGTPHHGSTFKIKVAKQVASLARMKLSPNNQGLSSNVSSPRSFSALGKTSPMASKSIDQSPLSTSNNKKNSGDNEPLLSLFGRNLREKKNKRISFQKKSPNSGNVMLGTIIRRKSCYCSDCGGMSSFEKKHLNIAIPPKRAFRNIRESRRLSRYIKLPTKELDSPRKSVNQKGSKKGLNGSISEAVEKDLKNDSKESSKHWGDLKKSLFKQESKGFEEKREEIKKICETPKMSFNDEVIINTPTAKTQVAKARGSFSEAISSQNTKFELKVKEKEAKVLPRLKIPNSIHDREISLSNLNQASANTFESREKGHRKTKAMIQITRKGEVDFNQNNQNSSSAKSSKLIMFLNKVKKNETGEQLSSVSQKRKIRDTYKLDGSNVMIKKIVSNPLSSSCTKVGQSASKVTVSCHQNVSETPPNLLKTLGHKENSKGANEPWNDPYNMVYLSQRSSNAYKISSNKLSFDKSKEYKTLEGCQSSNRSSKHSWYGITPEKRTNSLERSPKNENIKEKKIIKRIKGNQFEALGIDKIRKAYGSMSNIFA